MKAAHPGDGDHASPGRRVDVSGERSVRLEDQQPVTEGGILENQVKPVSPKSLEEDEERTKEGHGGFRERAAAANSRRIGKYAIDL